MPPSRSLADAAGAAWCRRESGRLTVMTGGPLGEDGVTGGYQRQRAGRGGVLTGQPAERAGRAEREGATREDSGRLAGPTTLQQAAEGHKSGPLVTTAVYQREIPSRAASNLGSCTWEVVQNLITSALRYRVEVNILHRHLHFLLFIELRWHTKLAALILIRI